MNSLLSKPEMEFPAVSLSSMVTLSVLPDATVGFAKLTVDRFALMAPEDTTMVG